MPIKAMRSGSFCDHIPLGWVAIFQRENIGLDVSASTGEHNAAGLIKQLLAGAHTVQVVSVLYQKGLEYMAQMLDGLTKWMQEKGYELY